MSDRMPGRRLPHLTLLVLLLALVCAPAVPAAAQEPVTGSEAGFEDPFAEEGAEIEVADPIEPFNRAMFWFNDKLYFYLFKPVARGYRVVMPETARVSVDNFFDNLGAPVRMVNAALQLKFADAGRETGRFLLNSTAGVAGLFDFAGHYGLKEKEEDFGQTLGRYGIGPGFYLVLPILGPSNARDAVGEVGDYFVDPLTSPFYLKLRDWEYLALKSYDRINWLSLDKDTYESIKEQSLDPYLTVRDAYAQRRRALVNE